MRPKFLLALAAVTGLILAAVLFLHQKPQSVQTAVVGDVALTSTAKLKRASRVPVTVAVRVEPVLSPEEKRAVVNRQVQQLHMWAQSEDAAGLENIMQELATNPESKVRFAAITAARQSGSREIIPTLKEIAARTEDPKEKQAMLDAAEFLAQPTVSEQATSSQPIASTAP